MPDLKEFINGFGGRVILISLTTLTSVCTSIGMLFVKNIDDELNSVKYTVNSLVLSDKLTTYNKVDLELYNRESMLFRERFHSMDVRVIKIEESMKNTEASLGRIERRLGQPPPLPPE